MLVFSYNNYQFKLILSVSVYTISTSIESKSARERTTKQVDTDQNSACEKEAKIGSRVHENPDENLGAAGQGKDYSAYYEYEA